MPTRMTAVDAQFYWMSAKVPNDQFLLYAFSGVPIDFARAVDEIRDRANACPALAVRVEDGSPLTYPHWVPTSIKPDRIVHHHLDDDSWQGCLEAVGRLADRQLEIRQAPWRVHVFVPIADVSGTDRPGTVAVLQIAHALADGNRGAALAAWLFGRPTPLPDIVAPASGFLPWRGVVAAHAHRQLLGDIAADRLRPPLGAQAPIAINSPPRGRRYLRTLVRHRSQLSGPTVTVAVLAAVSGALAHIGGPALNAEVPMAKPEPRQANNHFANVSVGLYPELERSARLRRIAADLADARARSRHRAARTADRAFAAVPAPLLRWSVGHFEPGVRPARVSGHTVVSSVNRGQADLHFGDAPVLLTAGYPALSPVIGLAHGVHGIGDTVAISVHAAESAVGDVDAYVARLEAAL